MRRFLMLAMIVALALFFSKDLLAGDEIKNDWMSGFKKYRIKKGDTLSKIAPEYLWDAIMRINRIDESHLPAGKEIIIPINNKSGELLDFCPVLKETRIKSEKVIIVFLHSQYFGAYNNGWLEFWGPICSGRKNHETPRGEYKVLWKAKRYFSKKYDNAPMPYAVCISHGGYFLHQQSLVGRPSSHGCVRLLMKDAQKIFYWVEKSNRVIIQ